MKKLFLVSAVVCALSGSAAIAADLGNGFLWANEWTNTYNVEDDLFTSELESELSYSLTSELRAYSTFYADVKKADFTSSEIGLEYIPNQFQYLTTSAYVTLNDKFEDEKFFIEAVLKF